MHLDTQAIMDLKRFLDNINFNFLVSSVINHDTYFSNPLPPFKNIEQNINSFCKDESLKKHLKFFLLGDRILDKELMLPNSTIEFLVKNNILCVEEDFYFLNDFLLISCFNCYLFVANIHLYPTARAKSKSPYIGIDSFWLSRILLNKTYGIVLDVCTGSGIQAIISAKTCDRVFALELDSLACKIARINTVLNNVENKVKIINSDLFTNLDPNLKFDFIVSNPPFIPIPPEKDFPIFGNGGWDGLSIIKEILKQGVVRLKTNGQLIMIGQAIGTSQKCFLEDVIEDICPQNKTYLAIKSVLPTSIQAQAFAELSNIYNSGNNSSSKSWLNRYEEIGATDFYEFNLIINREKGEKIKIRNGMMITTNTMIKAMPFSIRKSFNMYRVQSITTAAIVDQDTLDLLKVLEESKTLSNAIDTLLTKQGKEILSFNKNQLLEKYMRICSGLLHQGLIEIEKEE